MALTGLLKPELKLILFGGKGGVGKTTCALCTGLYLADSNKNTLVISTDPAHSLGDSLGYNIGDEVTRIAEVERLSAIEIEAENALRRFKLQYDNELRRLFDTSTYLDETDIDAMLSLPIPGIDEVMGLERIIELIEEGRFEKYVLDTAPTGHALRLLSMPGLLDEWIKVMAKLRWKYRYMVERFSGEYRADNVDDFFLKMKRTIKKIEGLLKDHDKCEFVVVTISEDMAVRETERLIKTLRNYGLTVRQMVINNIIPECECNFCKAKKQGQEKYIRELKEKFADLNIITIPEEPQEIKGINGLRGLKQALFTS